MRGQRPETVLFKAMLWNGLIYLTWPIWLPFVVLRECGRAMRKLVRTFKRAGDEG